ncbi:MAG: isoprenylcysteine carboxylmethyltransferase family protein [Acidobacteriota bacterium]|nr:isoprenylcysteine carboxylmethyltransferase family protein [Acidobacteriota bacterium]
MWKASAFEIRFRSLIYGVLYGIGLTAPWNRWLHVDSAGPNAHLWGTLAARLSMSVPAVSIGAAFNLFLAAGILFAFVAAVLRTWASAHGGSRDVQDAGLARAEVVAAGPYRYVRHPRSVGMLVHTLALVLLMPPTGALFVVCSAVLFEARLITGEESTLAAKLGAPYLAYCAKVPRLVPRLTARVPASGFGRPRWGAAVVGELYFWGVWLSFAVVGRRYNSVMILQGVLISLGFGLIARAAVRE